MKFLLKTWAMIICGVLSLWGVMFGMSKLFIWWHSPYIPYIINELQVDPRNLTIDRINNDGHYERGNIRFVSYSENLKNRRTKQIMEGSQIG